jgi:hypothetical protein
MQEQEQEKPKRTRDIVEQEKIVQRIERLSTLRGIEDCEVVGYVYREHWDKSRVALPPISQILMDHEFAPMFGPGKFYVSYFRREDTDDLEAGKLKSLGSIQYSIGLEYAEIHREFCRSTGRPCMLDGQGYQPGHQRPQSGLAELLDVDKMKAAAGFLASLKLILHPENGAGAQNEKLMVEMVRALGARNQGPAPMGEMIVSEALKMITSKPAQEKAPGVLDQVNQLVQLREALGSLAGAPAAEEPEESSPMEKMISKALDNLPELLKAFNGNVAAAAEQAKKKHPIEAALIKHSPDLQRQFYSAMVEKYGAPMANQWAASYGIQPPAVTIHQAPPDPRPMVQPIQVNGVMQL